MPAEEVARLSPRKPRHATGARLSARNRFTGIVRSVEVEGVMALVEIEAGPFLVTAAVTRDSVEELGLVEGVEATATVKATSVMIEREMTWTTVADRSCSRRCCSRSPAAARARVECDFELKFERGCVGVLIDDASTPVAAPTSPSPPPRR